MHWTCPILHSGKLPEHTPPVSTHRFSLNSKNVHVSYEDIIYYMNLWIHNNILTNWTQKYYNPTTDTEADPIKTNCITDLSK